MDMHRLGEIERFTYRAGRFFSVGQNWYFATREGVDQGPFGSREEAEAAALCYVRERIMEEETLFRASLS